MTAKAGDHHPTTIQNPTVLYHLGDSALVIKGATTDITYLFGDRKTSLQVDERDVQALLATGRFFASLSD